MKKIAVGIALSLVCIGAYAQLNPIADLVEKDEIYEAYFLEDGKPVQCFLHDIDPQWRGRKREWNLNEFQNIYAFGWVCLLEWPMYGFPFGHWVLDHERVVFAEVTTPTINFKHAFKIYNIMVRFATDGIIIHGQFFDDGYKTAKYYAYYIPGVMLND